LGRWNWYLPRWLRWLPGVSLDEKSATSEPGAGDSPELTLRPTIDTELC
jgi:RND superfamily putative drug exporter